VPAGLPGWCDAFKASTEQYMTGSYKRQDTESMTSRRDTKECASLVRRRPWCGVIRSLSGSIHRRTGLISHVYGLMNMHLIILLAFSVISAETKLLVRVSWMPFFGMVSMPLLDG